tara:strand:- start:1683 stop:1841 length:159 start_codon:yes stop_codon:yes gene_type:complete
MNKNNNRRNFLKKNLILLLSFSFINLNIFLLNAKSLILKKKSNFVWFLNKND